MLGPLGTLRSRLLAGMIGTALVALALAYLVVGNLQESRNHHADQSKAHRIAATLSRRVAFDQRRDPDDLDHSHLAAYQALLPDDQLVVKRGGRVLYSGRISQDRKLELSSSAAFPGGVVTVRDYTTPGHTSSITAIVVAGGVAAVVMLAAIAVATLLTRAVRGPVQRAIAAADRVAAGDLGARMGTAGPEELARLGHAFDGMAQRLQSADLDQRRFLADVAHEIATPTNTISGFGLALSDGTLRTDEERGEAQELITHETARLRSLLDDLRELTRLDLTETVRQRRLDLRVLCDRVAGRLKRDAQAAEVALEVHVGRGTIVSDERLLDMILSNLVGNALRYTPPGGRVVLSARRHRHELVLAITDTGIGIAPEHQERIFDRLYRVESARSRGRHGSQLDDDPDGSGLGLPIAQRAAQALNGRIELTSEPGRGSEFRVVLPVGDRQSARPGAGSSGGASPDAATNRGSTSANVDPSGDEDTVQQPP